MPLALPSEPSSVPREGLFAGYDLDAAFDEMFDPDGQARSHCRPLFDDLRVATSADLGQRQMEADKAFLTQGITFTVYGDDQGTERIFPFDLVPRVITAAEWQTLERGLTQRLTAINLFLKDVYHDGRILAEGVVPRELVQSCRHYRREMRGVLVQGDIYVSMAGTDLVAAGGRPIRRARRQPPRAERRVVHAREPRSHQARAAGAVRSLSRPAHRAVRADAAGDAARARAGRRSEPTFVVLTPGVGNSAYFEHAFLAREMGVALVEGRDLLVHDNVVYMRTTAGLRRVDVIYRRVDDDFLDPLAFRPDSHLGVAGLLNAYRAGNVSIANAIGTGLADDKALYAYIPAIIRFYLSEEPILANVETYLLSDPSDRQYVLEHLDSLVVKAVGESGGYGMLIGPQSTARARGVPREDPGRSPQLHRPADARAVARAVLHGRAHRAAARRSAAVRAVRRRRVDRARRSDARGAQKGIAGRELVAGRRQQGYLGAGGLTLPCCCRVSPTPSTGSAAISSARSTPRG